MIITALVNLYDRLVREGDESVAPKGYSRQQVSFKVILTKAGSLHGFEPVGIEVRHEIQKVRKGQTFKETRVDHRAAPLIVPGQSKPTGIGLNPCFLWDNAHYMLGFKADDPTPERTRAAFAAFRDKHSTLLTDIKDDGFKAVVRFLESWTPADASNHKGLSDMVTNFGVFQLRGESGYVHDHPAVRAWWQAQVAKSGADGVVGDTTPTAPSLTNGAPQPIARLHEPKIKGVLGAQSAGATLVSFNQSAFASLGKDQGFNAPVGVDDAFKYCTALNHLTANDHHRVRIGGDTIVFWTAGDGAADTVASGWFAAALDDSIVTDERIKGFMERVRDGHPVEELGDLSTAFYVLGLSPNKSRLAVRLWLESTVGQITDRVAQHYRALQLEPVPDGGLSLSIRRVVEETAPPKKGFADSDRVNPTLAAGLTRSILTGAQYPRALLAGVIERSRVEGLADRETRKDFRTAQHRRCAVIRACLTRNHNLEVPVSLDPDRTDPPYLLGRLFAVLERAQQNALGQNLNRTIKDTYYGAASSTPSAIFPRLLSLSRHHVAKIDSHGQRVKREQELGAIVDQLKTFPRLLGLEAQGLFAIGYFHQRESYFGKRGTAAELSAQSNPPTEVRPDA